MNMRCSLRMAEVTKEMASTNRDLVKSTSSLVQQTQNLVPATWALVLITILAQIAVSLFSLARVPKGSSSESRDFWRSTLNSANSELRPSDPSSRPTLGKPAPPLNPRMLVRTLSSAMSFLPSSLGSSGVLSPPWSLSSVAATSGILQSVTLRSGRRGLPLSSAAHMGS